MTAASCTSCGQRARHTARNSPAPFCRECIERGHDLKQDRPSQRKRTNG